jgi:transposase
MGNARHTAKFKADAIKQITERGHGILEASKRLS